MKKAVRITWTDNLLSNESRFKQEAEKMGGIDIDFITYFNLYYQNWLFRDINTQNSLKSYDIRWIWGKRGKSMKDWIIYKYWHLLDKTIVDKSKKYMISNDKFLQTVFLEHLWYFHPKTLFFVTKERNISRQIEILEKELSYPFIAKEVDKDQWKWVYFIEDKNSLEEIFQENIENWLLFQEYIKNQWDYRVLVIWNQTLGAIKRHNPEDFKNNISTGWTTQFAELPEEIYDTAIKVAHQFELNIAWIDFFLENWTYHVIEINELPQYKWFEEGTWLNYPQTVLEYFKNL